MRKTLWVIGFLLAFGLATIASSAATNFAGTWALDKTKSQGLSQRMQNADSVTLTITQDANSISLDQKVVGGQPAGGGGGGGGRGGGGPMGPQSYKLDGSEVSSDVNFGQMTGKAVSKATWSGSSLQLSRKTTVTTDQGDRVSTNTQTLSLSGDGKVLTVASHAETARGSQDSTLVYNKQ